MVIGGVVEERRAKMTRHARYVLGIGVFACATLAPIHAQERLGSVAAPDQQRFAGWTFTPTFGFGETYDDNVSLFSIRTAEEQNNDVIASYFPGADLRYAGRHTSLGMQYSGSFLDYRTFSTLNRWDQHGGIELLREESARVKWFAQGNAAALPSTDFIELGGIPFRQIGAQTLEGRGGVDYLVGSRSQISSSLQYQDVTFDRSSAADEALRGGHVLESLSDYRYRINERTAVGADYSYSRATVVGDLETFNIHSAMGAVDYAISPGWTLSAGAGVVYLEATAFSPSHNAPAGRASLDRHNGLTTFHVGYMRSYIPSFGLGGTSTNQEIGVGFRTPLFNSRRFYTTQSAVFRDDVPLTDLAVQLPFRSLRTSSVIGFEPDRWVRIEGFYSRVQQTTLRFGGQVYRNQVGVQIVTSKPMRIQ
jgi:hypothetical protein